MPEMSASLSPRLRHSAADGSPVLQVNAGANFVASTPAGNSGAKVAIQIFADMNDAAAEWKAFEAQADCTPFQTFGWLDNWQRHIGARMGTIPAIVFGRDSGGDILFILPLAVENRSGLRRLMWLGSELGDYDAPLLASHFPEHPCAKDFPGVWHLIVKNLRAVPRFRFDLVDLQKMPEYVGKQKNPLLALKVLPNRSGAYVATLGNDWEQYYTARRSSSTRRTARRKLRQLEEYGALRFSEVSDIQGSARTLETLMEQKSRYLVRLGVENIFERPGYRDFYLAMATDAQVSALAFVSRLDIGDTVAATSFGLKFRGAYYLTLSSYYDGEMSRFGPGVAHLHELLRHAIQQGSHSFDFTIGDEPYKLDWADIKLSLYDHLAAYTLRGWSTVLPTILARRAKRFIKQTPVLWRAVSKGRRLLARLKPSKSAGAAQD